MPADTTSSKNESQIGGTPGSATGAGAAQADLETQISRLREDVAGVSEALKSLATSRAGDARDQAYALRDDVKERGERYFKQAQDAASDLEDQISDRVREEPIKAVLIAAAVGYLYARLFR